MIIAVTNRHLCKGDFLEKIEQIAKAKPHAILLREKDLPENVYRKLAQNCNAICKIHSVQFIAHSFPRIAQELEIGIHLPFQYFQNEHLTGFQRLGASVHSAEEAILAVKRGANYLIAGHIFATDCKRGVDPRGLEFLQGVCKSVKMPVFAIGGISPLNVRDVMKSGAAGVCLMSGLMMSDQPDKEIDALRSDM